MFVSESDAGVSHDIVLGARRQAYLVCIEGSMAVGTSDTGELSVHMAVAELLGCRWVVGGAACGKDSMPLGHGAASFGMPALLTNSSPAPPFPVCLQRRSCLSATPLSSWLAPSRSTSA